MSFAKHLFSVVLSLLISHFSEVFSQDTQETIISTKGAIARFNSNNIDGFVKVINGHILFNLTINNDFDWDSLDTTASSCLSGGLYYGIYESWSYNSDQTDQIGSDSCGPDYTGYRWDPWLACSTLSSNTYCTSTGSTSSCIPPNSLSWDEDDDDSTNNQYVCNQYNYLTNPYKCEIGDWSGKYGLLTFDQSSTTSSSLIDSNTPAYSVITSYSSAFEVDSYDLGGKSLVFRCQNNKRAFCTSFQSYTPTTNELEEYPRQYQETFYDIDDSSDDTSDNIYSMKAQFDSTGDNYVLLTYYNTYEIILDSSNFDVPGGCGDYINIRIFNNWDSDVEQDCVTNNMFWDPTITCIDDTENGEDNGKGYCNDDGYICNDEEWSYECKDYLLKDGYNNRILCAPGDLSGKYGAIDISDNVNFGIFKVNGSDSKIPPMSLLEGKSVVLQCSLSEAIIDCAPLLQYTDDIGKIWGESDSSEESNKNKKNNNNSFKLFGLGDTILIVLGVLALAAVIPCIRGIKKMTGDRRKDSDDEEDDGFGVGGVDGVGNRRKRKNKNDDNGDEESGRTKESTAKAKRTVPSMQQGMGV